VVAVIGFLDPLAQLGCAVGVRTHELALMG
jgi:hypothetical protein